MLLVTSWTLAHPFHVSIAEAEWSSKTKSLEVALRVHPSDLEKALSRRAKKTIDLDKTPKIDVLIQDYLKEVFQARVEKAAPEKIKWVGKEVKVKHAWLYFEIPLESGLSNVQFTNRIFFELLEDQVNTINFRDRAKKRRKSLTFNKKKPTQTFQWTP